MRINIYLFIIGFFFSNSLFAQLKYNELEKAQAKLWKDDTIRDRHSLDKNSLDIYSDDNYKFTLYLNEKKQNATPLDEIKVEGLNNPYYDVRLVFEEKTLPEINKKVKVVTPQGKNADVIYKIKYDNSGQLILALFVTAPVLKNALSFESGRRITDVSGGSGGSPFDNIDEKSAGAAGGTTSVTSTTTSLVTNINKPRQNNTSGTSSAQSGNQASTMSASPSSTETPVAASSQLGAIANTMPSNTRADSKSAATDIPPVITQTPSQSFSGTITTTKVESYKDTTGASSLFSSDSVTRASEVVTFSDAPTMAVEQEKVRTDASDNDWQHFHCEPIGDSAYNALIASIPPKVKDEQKLLIAELAVEHLCLSAEQILNVCQLMAKDKARLEFGEYCYPRCADPYNYRVVGGSMFSVRYQVKLQSYVSRMNKQ